MDVSRRRPGVKTSVVAGSVWESRMKLDEVRGGIKVFNGEGTPEESGETAKKSMVKKGQTGTSSSVGVSGKRKTWKYESSNGPIQIAKGKTCEEQCRELSVSADGIKKSPIQARKGRSFEGNRELSVSVDGIDKTPIQAKKGRSSEGSKEVNVSVDGIVKSPVQLKKGRSEANKEVGVSIDGNEKSSIQTRKPRSDIKEIVESDVPLTKVKSDSVKVTNQSGKDLAVDDGIERNSIQLRKAKSERDKVLDDSLKGIDESVNEIEKSPPGNEEIGAEESCKEFGVCQEKVISSSETHEATVKPPPTLLLENTSDGDDDHDHDQDDAVIDGDEEFEGDEEEEDIDEEIEIEIEKKSVEIKEINVQEEKPKKVEANVPEQKPKNVELSTPEQKLEANVPEQKPKNVELSIPEQKPKNLEINTPEQKTKKVELSIPEQKPKNVEISIPEQKLKKVVSETKKVHHFGNKLAPTSSTVNKQPPPVIKRATIYQNLAKPTPSIPVANGYQSFPETHNKLQNLVDLVMWRDISRSAFVFGIGTFIIISSSYTQDLNFSFISVISYLGLVYLAAIFLYRSLICRGVINIDHDRSYVVGEGEAIWLLKLVLPYLNEFLLKIRDLFSGDPSTTMKMAVLLFVFARCGSSITIWKMAKLGFFGVFLVPKVCSSYSTQLTAYGKFWIRRFRDAWDSCSHKKAVALGIFTLVWNLSSMVARIWAVFMMFVAVRYYQQSMERDDWVEEDDDAGADQRWDGDIGGKRPAAGPTSVEVNKVKKGS